MLKAATEAFLLLQSLNPVKIPTKDPDTGQTAAGTDDVAGDDANRGILDGSWRYTDAQKALTAYMKPGYLPYIDEILDQIGDRSEGGPLSGETILEFATTPWFIELIWSFWHEEGMLVQTMHNIARRFQNMRAAGGNDPLAHLKLDAQRPLSHLLWGWVEDEKNRLTIGRRAYEYDHEYGLKLIGKAVPQLNSVDSRSRFIETFHNLLNISMRFFHQEDDMTVRADAFPVLNGLREVHLVLTQGMQNQFGDLPWQSRREMLEMEWLLSQPEMHDFLGGSPGVNYPERWMAQVDTMKNLQGWTDVSVTHFRDLGVYGEQLLLSIRYHPWNVDTVTTQESARNWARYWRAEIQSYIHSYRAVTGVDLAADQVDTRSATSRYEQPATLHQNRVQQSRASNNGNGNGNGNGYAPTAGRRIATLQ